jgi:hypothetical protein
MGWLFCASSKDELVAHIEHDLSKVSGLTILGKAVRGSRLWYAVEHRFASPYLPEGGGEQRFIVLYLTECDRRDHPAYRWGYKDMDESMHPYYYDCPIRLLDLTPQAIESEWRKAVRAHHAKRKTVPKPEKHKVVTYGGERYQLNYPIAPRRGWDVTRVRDGMNFRMKAKQVNAALRQEEGK